MKVRWHGHSCFEFSDGDVTVVVDPHDGRTLGIKPPCASADVVLMTHDIYDHTASRVIRGIHKDHLTSIGEFSEAGMSFTGLQTFMDNMRGEERGINAMYLFEMDGITVCHCGDIGCIPDEDVIDRIRGVDMLFVPTGEMFTLAMPELRRFLELVNPNVIIPMHYRVGGLSIPLSPIDDFLDMIPEGAVDYVGNEIDVCREDIDGMKQCWVFDR